jgi:hypothetical protein
VLRAAAASVAFLLTFYAFDFLVLLLTLTLWCSIMLPLSIGPSGSLRGPREVPQTYESTTDGGPNARGASAVGPPCVAFSYVLSTSWGPGRPRKARFKVEALLSNIGYAGICRKGRGLHVLCFYMCEATPGAPGRPRNAHVVRKHY